MVKRKIRYLISYTTNMGERTTLTKEFKKIIDAKREIRRLLSPGKYNVKGNERTRRTAPRNGLPYGFNNPRIIKRRLFR